MYNILRNDSILKGGAKWIKQRTGRRTRTGTGKREREMRESDSQSLAPVLPKLMPRGDRPPKMACTRHHVQMSHWNVAQEVLVHEVRSLWELYDAYLVQQDLWAHCKRLLHSDEVYDQLSTFSWWEFQSRVGRVSWTWAVHRLLHLLLVWIVVPQWAARSSWSFWMGPCRRGRVARTLCQVSRPAVHVYAQSLVHLQHANFAELCKLYRTGTNVWRVSVGWRGCVEVDTDNYRCNGFKCSNEEDRMPIWKRFQHFVIG